MVAGGKQKDMDSRIFGRPPGQVIEVKEDTKVRPAPGHLAWLLSSQSCFLLRKTLERILGNNKFKCSLVDISRQNSQVGKLRSK